MQKINSDWKEYSVQDPRSKLCSTLLLVVLGMVGGCFNNSDLSENRDTSTSTAVNAAGETVNLSDCPPADAPDRPTECEGVDGTAPPPQRLQKIPDPAPANEAVAAAAANNEVTDITDKHFKSRSANCADYANLSVLSSQIVEPSPV